VKTGRVLGKDAGIGMVEEGRWEWLRRQDGEGYRMQKGEYTMEGAWVKKAEVGWLTGTGSGRSEGGKNGIG
jgi:hypothetical protein